MPNPHPHTKESGEIVYIRNPSQPTAPATWTDALAAASAVPGQRIEAEVCGVPLGTWTGAPRTRSGWEQLVESTLFEEPPFKAAPGSAPASGAVVLEPDGRVWLVSPTNRFGGYENTFPKGKVDPQEGLSLRANAIREVFEESGLQVELVGFLIDTQRSTSTTRYYLARRLGGSPADMGWESQAVHLVPLAQLAGFASHKNDQPIVKVLAASLTKEK